MSWVLDPLRPLLLFQTKSVKLARGTDHHRHPVIYTRLWIHTIQVVGDFLHSGVSLIIHESIILLDGNLTSLIIIGIQRENDFLTYY
jgi:hypothetical protein